MEHDYINGCELYYDTAESDAEQGAAHQQSLDVLYSVGCQYNINEKMMRQLCRIALIDFKELQRYSGAKA